MSVTSSAAYILGMRSEERSVPGQKVILTLGIGLVILGSLSVPGQKVRPDLNLLASLVPYQE